MVMGRRLGRSSWRSLGSFGGVEWRGRELELVAAMAARSDAFSVEKEEEEEKSIRKTT